MAGTIINVTFYSWQPLPMEIRPTFELPSWPYGYKELPKDVEEYFKQYSIFYYRDSICKDDKIREGLVVDGSEKIQLPIDCYAHSCYIDYGMRTFKVVPWWGACSRSFVKECVETTGDDYAWTVFNEHRIVKQFNSRFIKSSKVGGYGKKKGIAESKDVF